jgi:glycosyltransferase involved in cell wall biosynthesis
VHFIVCGEPTDYQSPPGYGMRMVEALTQLRNVNYRGRVTPDEAMNVIANAALLLCTSDEEGFPNTFTQAWTNGTPIVTLKVDPDDIIEKLGLGSVSKRVDKAIEDIESLIKSSQRREEISGRARRYIAENHNEAAVVQIFNNTLGNNDPTVKREDMNLKAGDLKC